MKVALVGNQNSGKTTLFNKLTGSNQKIGNWPGVTIDKKEGFIKSAEIELIDLPGIYSLSTYTSEENITRDYLINKQVDVIVNLVDVNSLERGLYLTTQLLDLEIPFVVALNLVESFEKKGMHIDEKELSKDLGVKVVKISAKTGKGLGDLIQLIKQEKTQKSRIKTEKYSKIIENIIQKCKKDGQFHNDFLVLESIADECCNDESIYRARDVLKKLYGFDLNHTIASQIYDFISKIKCKCVIGEKQKKSLSDKIDNIILNKWLAIPIFLIVMMTMYYLSVGVVGKLTGSVLIKIFDNLKNIISIRLINLGASKWIVSLLCDGIISGIGSVLSFLPQLIVIFICLNLLEASGYMSRIAFIFDSIFYKFGMSGKSLIPFIIGSGCSVPAISSTRTIEQSSEKEKTIILAPFVPCSAKLPIISLFVGWFFPKHTGLIVVSIYFFAIIVILISALILDKIFFRNKQNSFVSEMPEYKMPSAKLIAKDVCIKIKEFVIRAGTVIVVCSIIVWFLSRFSVELRFCNNIESSILAKLGKMFSWFFYPIIGELNWGASVSAIQGLIAKEQVVSSMNIIAGLSGCVGDVFGSGIFAGFNKASAYAFVLFNLFSAPCLASISAMRNELKSTKKTIFALSFQIVFAWLISSLVFHVGRLFI